MVYRRTPGIREVLETQDVGVLDALSRQLDHSLASLRSAESRRAVIDARATIIRTIKALNP